MQCTRVSQNVQKRCNKRIGFDCVYHPDKMNYGLTPVVSPLSKGVRTTDVQMYTHTSLSWALKGLKREFDSIGEASSVDEPLSLRACRIGVDCSKYGPLTSLTRISIIRVKQHLSGRLRVPVADNSSPCSSAMQHTIYKTKTLSCYIPH